MATKKVAAKNKNSKPTPKVEKKKSKMPTVTLNSMKVGERFDGIDQRLTSIKETVHRQGIIQEKIQGDIKLIAEGFEALDNKIDGVEMRLAETIEKGITDLTTAISSFSKNLGQEVPFPLKRTTPE